MTTPSSINLKSAKICVICGKFFEGNSRFWSASASPLSEEVEIEFEVEIEGCSEIEIGNLKQILTDDR
jgi:hypothetical protein